MKQRETELMKVSLQRTLSIIKPDAVSKGIIGEILSRFEKKSMNIIALQMTSFTTEEARSFYEIHKDRPFYQNLVAFMTEGPIVALVLQGDHIVEKLRTLMGATNPKEAALGTIRRDLGESIERNVIHGSDSIENAQKEVSFFLNRKTSLQLLI